MGATKPFFISDYAFKTAFWTIGLVAMVIVAMVIWAGCT